MQKDLYNLQNCIYTTKHLLFFSPKIHLKYYISSIFQILYYYYYIINLLSVPHFSKLEEGVACYNDQLEGTLLPPFQLAPIITNILGH